MNINDLMQPAEADPALNDHPDVTLNPVIMYQIKRAKEEMRTAQRRASLLAEGFDPSEVDERMQIEQTSGGGGRTRPNALALLVSLGARVEPTGGGSSQEHAQLQDRRRLQRNVDAYLSKSVGVEKYRSDKPSGRDHVLGGRRKTAHEVARDTTSFGGEQHRRLSANVQVAREARVLYRKWWMRHWEDFGRDPNYRKREVGGVDVDLVEELRNEIGAVIGEGGGEEENAEEGEEGEDDEYEDANEEAAEKIDLEA